MGKKANPKVIGIFVLGAIALAIGGILIFGGGKFLIQKKGLVMYFESSVKGLNVGSALLFRGVKVGEVSDIQAEFHREKLDIRIPVFVEMEPGRFKSIGITKDLTDEERKFLIGTLIERGLRATLEIESLVTGQKAVSLQFMPETPVKLVGGNKKMLEIPTIETGLAKFTKKIEDLPLKELIKTAITALSDIDKAVIDFRKLAQDIDAQVEPVSSSVVTAFKEATTTLRNANKVVQDVGGQVEPLTSEAKAALSQAKKSIKSVGSRVGAAADDAGRLVRDIDKSVDPVVKKTGDALLSAKAAFDEIEDTFSILESSLKPNSALRIKMETALTDISAATRSIRALADLLERKPSSLLAGRGSEGRLYVLTSLPNSTGGARGQSSLPRNISIAVGPIELAHHLDRPQIVTTADGTEVKVARDDQWAGGLKENFTRVLQENLSGILSSKKIYAFPSDSDRKIDYHVKIMVNRFEARPRDKSVLGVRWSILDKDGEKVLLSRVSSFSEKSSSSKFGGSVAALSKNISKLSREIATELRKVVRK